jgi:hypothetical protein
MKTNDLIERYVYAISRQLPAKSREDTAKELRTLIADMLAERGAEQEPSEEDVRAVLTELGRPDELAQKYLPAQRNCLIGQPHFRVYQLVLKIVLGRDAVWSERSAGGGAYQRADRKYLCADRRVAA